MKYDPHEPGRRIKKYEKNFEDEDFLLTLNQVLHKADISPPEVGDIEKLPLIYIGGAPRSGHTLLSQIVSRFLPVGYIDNLIARFWLKPSIGITLSKIILGEKSRETITFKSTHGTTEEVSGPHEFGYFWRYWLKIDKSPTHHLSDDLLRTIDRVGLKYALEHEILASFGKPVVFKSVVCGFHASYLTEIHSASLFIDIKRDLFKTAASILRVRMARYGSYGIWWSLKPSTYPFKVPPDDPAAEVAVQVKECRREIEEELAKPSVKSMSVSYEELCENPLEVIDEICLKLREMGFDIQRLSSDIPHFTISDEINLPPELESRLRECLDIVEK